jgi:hypothetical protein
MKGKPLGAVDTRGCKTLVKSAGFAPGQAGALQFRLNVPQKMHTAQNTAPADHNLRAAFPGCDS